MGRIYKDELERTIANWYMGDENTPPHAVFNILCIGLNDPMSGVEVIVPVETPEGGFPEEGSEEDIPVVYRSLQVEDEDKFVVPVFTSQVELEKGEPTSAVTMPLSEVYEDIMEMDECDGIVVNPWGKQMTLEKNVLEALKNEKPHSCISLIRGSVVDMNAGAIVNAANTSLLGGGGVDGAIHKAAGPELLAECRTLNGCETGGAKITGAYGIKNADYIIHTVGPVYHGREEDADLLASCYWNSMELAYLNGCSSIAFPCISTGVYGYPIKEASEVALNTVAAWLNEHEEDMMNVYFCCFRDNEMEAYRKIMEK